MNMRIVGVPMIDRDPVQFGPEIPRNIDHQFPREGAEIAEFGGIFWRNDEAEMMPVILATLRERALVHRVRRRVKHAGFRSVPRHAISLQIGDVLGQQRRAKARAVMTNHARLHHHAS
jgi:hypothetical protein